MNKTSITTLLFSVIFFTNSSYAQLASYCEGPVIIMEAEGEVESVPDVAEVTLHVKNENEDATIALQGLAQNIETVISILKKLKITDQDIRTDTVNINANYGGTPYRMNNEQEVTGYTGTSFIYFKTNDIKNLSELVNNVMQGSENLFSNINYSSSKEDELLIQARELAYNKAYTKAKHYADLTGNKLGKICTVTEGDIEDITDIYGQMAVARSMGYAAMAQSVSAIPNIPIKPGSIKTISKVSIVYQLEN